MSKSGSSMSEHDRQVYLNGIKKFMQKGIPVIIDGEEMSEEELTKLFTAPEGTFYMADFVMEETPPRGEAMLKEDGPADTDSPDCLWHRQADSYSARGSFHLREIRFDLVYHS